MAARNHVSSTSQHEIASQLAGALRELRFVLVDLDFRALSPLLLPPFKGSTFRGAMGWALRRVVCLEADTPCRDCDHPEECLYPRLFRTALLPESSGRDSSPPPPFVLLPPLSGRRQYQPGDHLSCRLTLVGSAIESLPLFVRALAAMGRKGMGWGKGRCRLEGVWAQDGDAPAALFRQGRWTGARIPTLRPPEAPPEAVQQYRRLQLDFTTPLRLTSGGRLTARPEFSFLIQRLLERVSSLLNHYHQGCPRLPMEEILHLASQVKLVEAELQWFDWTRYSSLQNCRMQLGGVVGSAWYEGPVGAFLPLLESAQFIHVGKQASFGLGRVDVNLAYKRDE